MPRPRRRAAPLSPCFASGSSQYQPGRSTKRATAGRHMATSWLLVLLGDVAVGRVEEQGVVRGAGARCNACGGAWRLWRSIAHRVSRVRVVPRLREVDDRAECRRVLLRPHVNEAAV